MKILHTWTQQQLNHIMSYLYSDGLNPDRSEWELVFTVLIFGCHWLFLVDIRILPFEDFRLNVVFWWRSESRTEWRGRYAVHEIVTDAVEIFQKLGPFCFWHTIPYLFEDELMSISDDSANKRDVKQRYIIFYYIDVITLAEGSGCLFYFAESSLTLKVDLIGDDELPTIVLDITHFLHILLFSHLDIRSTDSLAFTHLQIIIFKLII